MIPISHYIYEDSVCYLDVGRDGMFSHKGLLRMLQETSARASDNCGYGLTDIQKTGVFWILVGWRVHLVEKVFWNTPITVESWPRSMEGFASERDFIVRAGDTLVARATSRWFLINASTGHIARVTETVKNAYPLDSTTLFDTPIGHLNGKTPPGTPVAYSTTIGRQDIDTNRHVNNIRYLDYALESLPQEIFDHLPDTLEIVYRKQILPGTTVQCLYSLTEDGRHQVELQSEQDGARIHHAFVWFY